MSTLQKYKVNGREIRQTVVEGAIDMLMERIDALRTGESQFYTKEMIEAVSTNPSKQRLFLTSPTQIALSGIESEFNLRFHSGIVKIESSNLTVSVTVRNGTVAIIQFPQD